MNAKEERAAASQAACKAAWEEVMAAQASRDRAAESRAWRKHRKAEAQNARDRAEMTK
jgi:hypothetical protein